MIWTATSLANSELLRRVAGQDVWVVEQGDGQAPTRLFIHCSLAHHETLMPLAGSLSPAHDIFFDMPGHGRSGAWVGDDYHSDTLAIASELLAGPTHVIGHSFGGTVALRLAAERPDLVSRLTLIEPVMFAATRGTKANEAHQMAMKPFIEAWTAGDRTSATQAFLDMWGNGTAWDDLSTRRRSALAAQIHLIPAAATAIEGDVHEVLAKLNAIKCPVDLIEGGASQPIMSAILDALAAGMPHAKRNTIDGAGHMMPLTHVAAVASALQDG